MSETSDTRISIESAPSPEDAMAVRSGLQAYNLAHSSVAEARPLAVFARDAIGTVIGGVLSETWGEWLDIWQVWVNPTFHHQGIGSRLLRAAEQEAIARGCRHAQLDTYTFQAPEFYAKQGYEVFGLLEGLPDGHKRFYLRKQLA